MEDEVPVERADRSSGTGKLEDGYLELAGRSAHPRDDAAESP